nr:hypothetical protein [Kofleriaceae bacterium]
MTVDRSTRAVTAAVLLVACGAPAIGPVPPGASGGPPGMTLVGGSDAGSGASGNTLGSAQVTRQDVPPAPGCLPPVDATHPAWLDVARVGGDLVACSVDATAGTPTRCFTVDAATGALAQHATIELPGYGYRTAAGWVASRGSDAVTVTDDAIAFGSGAPRKLRESKKNTLPDTAAPVRVFAAGDTAFVLASDGVLYVYVDGKPAQLPFHAMRSGGVGVSGGQVAVHEGALTRITVMDGLTRRTTHGRARHDETCRPDDSYGPGHEPEEATACGAHLAAHYRPYLATTIIPDGDGFLGVDARGALFRLDDKLAETARVPLTTCK